MIGGTRLGNPVEVMNAPGNEWTWIVWKFMLITVPTMIFLEWGWYQMKVGDLVRVKSIKGHPLGIVVEIDSGCGWPRVLTEDGRDVVWPSSQMELVDESR